MEGNTSRVIGTAALISVGVGTLNSFYKNKRPPSVRFLIGSGAAFVILSAIGEGEPEVAKALAIAVATTVVIGDGGGVLTYLNGKGEIDTKRNPNVAEDGAEAATTSADIYASEEGPFVPLEDPFQVRGAVINPNSVVGGGVPEYKPDLIGLIAGVV